MVYLDGVVGIEYIPPLGYTGLKRTYATMADTLALLVNLL